MRTNVPAGLPRRERLQADCVPFTVHMNAAGGVTLVRAHTFSTREPTRAETKRRRSGRLQNTTHETLMLCWQSSDAQWKSP